MTFSDLGNEIENLGIVTMEKRLHHVQARCLIVYSNLCL